MAEDTNHELDLALFAARARLDAASRSLSGRSAREASDAWRRANAELRRLERERAKTEGYDVVMSLEWEPAWGADAKAPHVFSHGSSAAFVYRAKEVPGAQNVHVIAEIESVAALRVAAFPPAARDGHALSGRGLDGAGAYRVERSRWHAQHVLAQPESGAELAHYAFLFEDCLLECLAVSFTLEPRTGDSLDALLAAAAARMA